MPNQNIRDTYKYEVRDGRYKIKVGITNDIVRRTRELKNELGDHIRVTQVGNRTTRQAALDWERVQRTDLRYRD